MSSMDRFVRWLTGEEGNENHSPDENPSLGGENPSFGERSLSRGVDSAGLPALESNAEPYGVTIETATVAPGTSYWRLTRVHHLSPEENKGRHHIYIDALKADGNRAFNTQARITSEGEEHTTTLDKPLNEPAANFPMFKWQKCTVAMQGMPSDKAHGITSNHPDEPNPDNSQSGNTLFHHSFLVLFQEVVAPQSVATGEIRGRVEHSRDGLSVELRQAGAVKASTPVAGNGTFGFEKVAPGDYILGLEDQSIPVQVQAGKTAEPVLVLAVSESIIEGTVHGGGGLLLRLVLVGEVIAEGPLGQSGSFRLRNLGAGLYHLHVLAPSQSELLVKSGALAMDGRNKRSVELTVPTPEPEPTPEPPMPVPVPVVPPVVASSSGSPLDHYVLFPDTDSPENRAQLTALFPQLAQKNLAFGFDHREAAQAKAVTVVGAGDSIPASQLDFLASKGVQVKRLAGTPAENAAQV
jgi:hypothetical protein